MRVQAAASRSASGVIALLGDDNFVSLRLQPNGGAQTAEPRADDDYPHGRQPNVPRGDATASPRSRERTMVTRSHVVLTVGRRKRPGMAMRTVETRGGRQERGNTSATPLGIVDTFSALSY